MYFPIGWPKVINTPELGQGAIRQITCNRDRLLFAILTDDSLAIWFCKPCVPIVFQRRSSKSVEKFGANIIAEWKPDSSMIVVGTSEGHLLFYKLAVPADRKGLYVQTDSPFANLRRDSAELFIKETIPPIKLTLSDEIMVWDGQITGMVCITMTELMIATTNGHVLRYRWDGSQNRDYALDLRRIPFCINQQVSKAIPIVEENTFIVDIEYSPLVGGFSIVLNDGRAAFLTATSLKFDPNQVQGIWAQGIEDASCTTINHKYRLITFGRSNSECIVYTVDESTGGLEVSHQCILSSKDYPGCPGAVGKVLWTPDGCALVASWSKGGIAMWSTFGALIMCSLGWDYGLNFDTQRCNPLQVFSMEFSTEGYQLWMVKNDLDDVDKGVNDIELNGNTLSENDIKTSLIQLDLVKSALTINPCMSHQSHLYLQGEDKLYFNSADTLIRMFSERSSKDDVFNEGISPLSSTLAEGRQWLIIPVPSTYSATNWPIRYSAIDSEGLNMAVAGKTGLAHYSMQTRRWKLFGNETQEKDFIVAGGLLWWRDYVVVGCYSIIDNADELRFYPRDSKLDNKFAKIVSLSAPIMLINILQDQLITFGSDAQVCIWHLQQNDLVGDVLVSKLQTVDISALAVHPACIASVTLTSLRMQRQNASESMVLNASGRLLLVQREVRDGEKYACLMPTVLASCVENVWVPGERRADKAHLTEALWLFCGAHGMRVWLPLYPRDGDKAHTFMSKRIMLPFHLKIYPLAILFEDAIILGAENDTVLYTSDSNSPFSLPFSVLQRTSQVYLHQILRQLIRRNLGYHAWEIARSCMSLPYFPHSLELLLHEVLEEEATSKEPIPDAQLPSIIEFIMEFPVYLQTVVQCARKTEIALWPYLFSVAGKPKDLFLECMAKGHLDTAASYLIILQNLETSPVSRQYATLLLNTALDQSKWELAKDLVRFLRAIDPNDVESETTRASIILPSKLSIVQSTPTPTVSPNAEDLSLILGNVQGPRVRSYSTTVSPKLVERSNSTGANVNGVVDSPKPDRKKSVPNSVGGNKSERGSPNNSAEDFFIDVILQKQARRLLSACRLTDLGYFAAHLDFHLVAWLGKERDRAARIDDFVKTLKHLHEDFNWPYPVPSTISPRKNLSNPQTPLDSPDDTPRSTIEDHLRSLKIDVFNTSSRVGDSGYMSFQGLPYTGLITPVNTLEQSSRIAESQLDDGSICDNDTEKIVGNTGFEKKVGDSFANGLNIGMQTTVLSSAIDESMMSTVSSAWGDDRELGPGSTDNWEVPSTQILEQLSNIDSKGSHKAEVRLRYLLQLFMEASCLEWSLLISVLLRDAMAVLRTVNAAKSHDQSIESVSRLRQGLLILNYWINSEWDLQTKYVIVILRLGAGTVVIFRAVLPRPSEFFTSKHFTSVTTEHIWSMGYKAFMLAIQNQISVLKRILDTKIQNQQIVAYQQAVSASLDKASSPKPSRSRNASSNQDCTTSQNAGKDIKLASNVSNYSVDKQKDITNLGLNENVNNMESNAHIVPESTGCVIS